MAQNGGEYKYYNHDRKIKFIDYLQENDTEYRNAHYAFSYITKLEETKNTDLAVLDNKVIVEHLLGCKIGTIYTYSYYYDRYKEWLANIDPNFVYIELSREIVQKILDELGYDTLQEEVQECLPYSIIRELMNSVPYKQYLLPIILCFEGIVGERGNVELISIKPEHINIGTCYIDIPSRKEPKINKILVPRSHINYMLDAYKEKEGSYIGDSEDKKKANVILQYKDFGYLVKVDGNTHKGTTQLNKSKLYKRLDYIMECYGKIINYRTLSVVPIVYSGIYYYMSMLEKHLKLELNNSHILKIMKRYDYGFASVSKTHQKYNIYRELYKEEIKKEPLTEDVIEVLKSLLAIKLTDEEEQKLVNRKYTQNNPKEQFDDKDYDDGFKENLGAKQQEVGTKGEKKVIKMIKDCNRKVDVHKVKDKHHFDILITNPLTKLEVKVTSKEKNAIHLSSYELKYGLKATNYYLVILYHNGKDFDGVKIITDIKDMYESAYKLIDNEEYKSFSVESENIKIYLKEDYMKEQQDFKKFIEDLLLKAR